MSKIVEIFILKNCYLEKLAKNSQKILRHRILYAYSKNTACLLSGDKILEIFALKFNFFQHPKTCHISIDDSGKVVVVFEEMRPKITTRCRNLRKHDFN